MDRPRFFRRPQTPAGEVSLRRRDPGGAVLAPVAVLAVVALMVLPLGRITAQSSSSSAVKGAVGAAQVLTPAATTVVGARKSAPPASSARKEPSVGRVVGTLRDAATGEPLVGGQVAVQGLTLGNVSDDTGAYFVNNVPPGTQTISVEYLGYESQAKTVEVKAGAASTLDFELTATPIEIEEVVVEEEFVADLSAEVEKVPAPSFKAAPVKPVEIATSDTTLMEEWHRSMRDFVSVRSIEYPMSGVKVYFRLPPPKRPAAQKAQPATEPDAAKASATPKSASPPAKSPAKSSAKSRSSSSP